MKLPVAKEFDFSAAGLIVRLKLSQLLTKGFAMQHNKPVWLSINLCLSLLLGALALSGCGGSCVGDACGTYAKFTVGGSVAGLGASKTVVLQSIAGDVLTVSRNGNFTFTTPVRNFKAYGVTVSSQPDGQICTVSLGGGIINVANVNNVVVTCLTQMGGAKQNISLNLTSAVTTLAGSAGVVGSLNGTGVNATFHLPTGITTDGTNLYVADNNNRVIRQINIISKVVTTIAGSGLAGSSNGTGINATFDSPFGITTDGTNLYVTDINNHDIRQVNIISKVVTTIAGSGTAGSLDGTGTSASFNSPYGITTDGTNLYVADTNNNVIRQINIISKVVTTIAGSGTAGSLDGTGTSASFNSPYGITTDGTNLYVADTNNNVIRQINIISKVVTTIAGSGTVGSLDGTGTNSTFNLPVGIATDGTNLYVADSDNHIIRKIVIASGAVTTLAGSAANIGSVNSTTGTSATFNLPTGITSDGFSLFVTDAFNHMIRKIQ